MASRGFRHMRALMPISLASLMALVLLIGLGNWQLDRHVWKRDLIETIDRRLEAPPLPIARVASLHRRGHDVQFMRAAATGQFAEGADNKVFTSMGGHAGWRVVTPLRLDDGKTLLIDRGFVPEHLQAEAYTPTPATQTITGIIRLHGAGRGWFDPGNRPEAGVWYWWDLNTMIDALPSELADGGVLPFVLQRTPPAEEPWPQPISARPDLPDNHLGYALTWFGLALCLVGVYIAYVIRHARMRR